jgi:hemerythrin-like domain-containing protein
MNLDSPQDRRLILEGVYFIRNYADKFHHAKEEEILFKSFDENLDILKVMHEDHEKARGHARAIEEAVKTKDRQAAAKHLIAYQELLTEHIRKEDEVLYPWMDGKLSTRQVGDLFSKFGKADEGMDKGAIQKCLDFITDLEVKLQRSQKEA